MAPDSPYFLIDSSSVAGISTPIFPSKNTIGFLDDVLFKKSYDAVQYIESKIKILNPSNILRRGYSITLKDSKPLKYIDDVKIGDLIKTVVFKGSLISRVKVKESRDGQKKHKI